MHVPKFIFDLLRIWPNRLVYQCCLIMSAVLSNTTQIQQIKFSLQVLCYTDFRFRKVHCMREVPQWLTLDHLEILESELKLRHVFLGDVFLANKSSFSSRSFSEILQVWRVSLHRNNPEKWRKSVLKAERKYWKNMNLVVLFIFN